MQRTSLRVALVGGLLSAAPFASGVPVVFTAVLSETSEDPADPSPETGFAEAAFDRNDGATLADTTHFLGPYTLADENHAHVSEAPEPTTLALVGAGLLLISIARRRRA